MSHGYCCDLVVVKNADGQIVRRMTGVGIQIVVVSIAVAVVAAVAVVVALKFVFVVLGPGPIDAVSCIAQPSKW